jgi:hypothetical protein
MKRMVERSLPKTFGNKQKKCMLSTTISFLDSHLVIGRNEILGEPGTSLQLNSFCYKQLSVSSHLRDNFSILLARSNKFMFPGLRMTHSFVPLF